MARRAPAASDPSTPWQRAADFAARKHRWQLRRDGATPYVSHVARVTLVVCGVFGCTDPVALAAALLHDTIEDTTTDYEDISERFGEETAACVAALTKNMALPEKERERDYDRRLAGADWRARLVKLADTFDNLCDAAGAPAGKEKASRTKKALGHCRRAVALARADRSAPGVLGRAADVVEAAMRRVARGR